LQDRIAEFRSNNIAVFAISYDSVGILSAFADKHGIEYTLLADEGSAVIKRLGLFNEHIASQAAAMGVEPKPRHVGIPYPGTFILNAAGMVTDKRFLPIYRERETAAAILGQGFGLEVAGDLPTATAVGGGVAVQASIDSKTFRFYQRLWLTVDLVPESGLHIYGNPVPEGFVAATVEIHSLEEEISVGQAMWPEPTPFQIPGLDEPFVVYTDRVRCRIPITFLARKGEPFVAIPVSVRYQACSDSDCLLPQSLDLTLRVERLSMA